MEVPNDFPEHIAEELHAKVGKIVEIVEGSNSLMTINILANSAVYSFVTMSKSGEEFSNVCETFLKMFVSFVKNHMESGGPK